MDQWAAHFQEKSERRRRRTTRATMFRTSWIALALTAGIAASFWATLTILELLESF